ncbi:putative Ig domain-containing protein [Actinoplanes utahensis]|nr:putative Ig domain-containing protein [Actinoplanes utahensis]
MLHRPPARGAGRCRRASDDAGFTMVETIASIAVVMVIMMALTQYFTNAMRINRQQGDRQIAVQLADSAMERVRALKVAAILTGRDKNSVQEQEQTPVPEVAAMMTSGFNDIAYDDEAPAGAGATAVLPTTPLPVTVNGLTYQQHFYIDTCERRTGTAEECSGKATGRSGYVAMYRVIVAVTWPNNRCKAGTCAFVTSTLIGSKSDEPLFNVGSASGPLDIVDPATTVYNDTGVAITFTPQYSGGTAPLTWTATDLPAGLSINRSTGTVSGTPTAAAGTSYPTIITAADASDQQDYIRFTWRLTTSPTMADPAAVYATADAPVNQKILVTNGAAPFTWSFTGLPPGVAQDTATETAATTSLTGTPTAVGTWNVGVVVTDNSGVRFTRTWAWSTALTLNFTAPTNSRVNTAITAVTPTVTGGTTPYKTYTAVGLPAGLTINSTTGTISGTPTAKTSTTGATVTITVTDSASVSASKIVTWKVA